MIAGEGAEAEAPDGAAVRADGVDLGASQPPPAADRVQRHAAVVVRRGGDPRARVVVQAHLEVRLVLVPREGEQGLARVVDGVGAGASSRYWGVASTTTVVLVTVVRSAVIMMFAIDAAIIIIVVIVVAATFLESQIVDS